MEMENWNLISFALIGIMFLERLLLILLLNFFESFSTNLKNLKNPKINRYENIHFISQFIRIRLGICPKLPAF